MKVLNTCEIFSPASPSVLSMRRHLVRFLLVTIAVSSLRAGGAAPSLSFNRDIRPILSDNCFRCHGADKNARKAKLRLDDRDVALDKEAFVPGKPDESELVRRIYATNEDDLMPPPSRTRR